MEMRDIYSFKKLFMAMLSEMQDFILGWRFIDEKYNKLPIEIIENITINSPEFTERIWKKCINDKYNHLMQLPIEWWKTLVNTSTVELQWGKNTNQSRENIKKMLLEIDDNEYVIIFWSGKISIRTTWGIFLDYWDDFFYPSDDSGVVLIEKHKKILTYIEDYLSLYSW